MGEKVWGLWGVRQGLTVRLEVSGEGSMVEVVREVQKGG